MDAQKTKLRLEQLFLRIYAIKYARTQTLYTHTGHGGGIGIRQFYYFFINMLGIREILTACGMTEDCRQIRESSAKSGRVGSSAEGPLCRDDPAPGESVGSDILLPRVVDRRQGDPLLHAPVD